MPTSFFPPCPIHALTGLLCPGCGGTRCLLALLHGDLHAAWHHNALLTIVLPAALLLLVLDRYARARHHPSPAARLAASRPLPYLLALITAVFTITRNLPG